MSFSINLFWRQAPRHAIARLDLGRLRQLLQLLTEQGEFPADAIHCDPRVQARDVSIARQSLARIARAIDADHTTIGVMDEAQFTRSKLRILICPITRHPLLAVSPVIDIDIATLTIALTIFLVPVNSDKERAPKYEIRARNPGGRAVQIGALWEQTARESGECFLQGRIDDHTFAAPLQISAFRQRDGSYNIVWQEQRRAANSFAANDMKAASDAFAAAA